MCARPWDLAVPASDQRAGGNVAARSAALDQRYGELPRLLKFDGRGLTVLQAPLLAGARVSQSSGTPIRNGNFRKQVAWGELTTSTDLPGLRLHDLRHTAASLMIASGASVVEIAAVLGHSSSQTTLTIYAHLSQDRLGDVSDRLGQAIADSYGQNPATSASDATDPAATEGR